MSGYKSKTTFALETIRERILSGEVARGERFDVRSLADELGMSITPVREALRILQTDGLVSYEEHRAISALTLSREEAEELYVLRSMLESFATQRACERWDGVTQEEASSIHDKMIAAVEAGDIEAAGEANRDFHFLIYRVASTRFIEPMISRLWDQYAWSSIWSVPRRLHDSIVEHAAVLEALACGDAESAASLMRAHIDGGAEAVRTHGDQ